MGLCNIYHALDSRFPVHLEAIREFVRQPSISHSGLGILETAEQVKHLIEQVGGRGEILPTNGHPVVLGDLMLGRRKTLLVYGMYDVMPVEGEEWIAPPFAADIVELSGLGPCVVGRGIYNTKGPLQGFFNTVSTIQDVDSLPVNLKFLIEGEEELGSKHLPEFIDGHTEELNCDAVFFPFYSLNRRGRPVMYLGAKGVLTLELVCEGGEWGGPKSHGIHSSHGAWISSPVWKLVHALASMVGEDESPTIDNLEKVITGTSVEDEELLARLNGVFDERAILEENDVSRFKYEARGIQLLRKYLFSPAINIDGLLAGHVGAGPKTVIDHRAVAKLDIRLVPNMTVEDTLTKVRKHLRDHGFDDVAVENVSGYDLSRTSVDEEVVQAMLRSYRHHGCEAEIWPYIGGSAPFHLFTRELGLPLVVGGLCHGGGAHGPNEYAVVQHLKLFEKSVATFLFEYASESATVF
jgi:acetylornithine deacetylase/succinyl-diaminopimelate desuccinylase-like protein